MEPHNPLARVRVVGFDLDQTLYPKSPLVDAKIQEYLYQKIAEHRHVTLSEAERLFKERYQGGAGLSGRQTLEDLGLPDASEAVQEALERSDIASTLMPDPDTSRLLADVRSHYEGMDLITGSDMSQTEKKLRALGLEPYIFSHIIAEDQATKSTGESYRLWLSLYPHLAPEQFLYIGDRVRTDHDVPSALGIQTALVYVTNPDTSVPALQLPRLNDLRLLLLPD